MTGKYGRDLCFITSWWTKIKCEGEFIYMTEFVNFWKNYINFSARTTRRGYWMAFLFLFIIAIVVTGIATATGATIISNIWQIAILIPSLAIWVRRIRDCGKHWAFIFIPIYNIILLFLSSAPDDGRPVV